MILQLTHIGILLANNRRLTPICTYHTNYDAYHIVIVLSIDYRYIFINDNTGISIAMSCVL